MKRYFLFIFQSYYPTGGMEDFVGAFNTVDEAAQKALDLNKELTSLPSTYAMVGVSEFDRAQIYDNITGTITNYILRGGVLARDEEGIPLEYNILTKLAEAKKEIKEGL